MQKRHLPAISRFGDHRFSSVRLSAPSQRLNGTLESLKSIRFTTDVVRHSRSRKIIAVVAQPPISGGDISMLIQSSSTCHPVVMLTARQLLLNRPVSIHGSCQKGGDSVYWRRHRILQLEAQDIFHETVAMQNQQLSSMSIVSKQL